MIISDLAHMEVVSEATNLIKGGWKYTFEGIALPYAKADAASISDAIGCQTITNSVVKTATVSGLFSSSIAAACSESIG
jgi:hypothetical protein